MIGNLVELYRYRALVGALVVRHLHTRYRGSALGLFWSLLNPLLLMAVYTLVFHYFMRSSNIENYSIFVFAGLLPWLWTTSGMLEGTNSIVASGHLITKSLFPAHVLPVVSVLTNLINFVLSIPVMFVFIYFSGAHFYQSLWALPLLLFIHLIFISGCSVGLSALNVQFRDVQHVVGNLFTFIFFLSPIVYSPQIIPEKYRAYLVLNPFALFTVSYHEIILEGTVPWGYLGSLFALSLIVLILGYAIFDRFREGFAEQL